MTNPVRQLSRLSKLAVVISALSGCETGYLQDGDIRLREISERTPGRQLSVNRELVSVSDALKHYPVEADYRVNTGDTLRINIYSEPGMTDLESRIDANGLIQLPVVESFVAAGKTPAEIQQELKALFTDSFREPWVVVSVSAYGSRPLYILGEFNHPGVLYMDRPTNIVQALSLARGLGPDAFLPGARLIRNNRIVPVDIHGLLRQGRLDQNIWVLPGDTLYVPANRDLKVYVLGAVKVPGVLSFAEASSVLEALAQTQGSKGSSARLSDTRIIRTHTPTRGELMIVNVKDILEGKVPDLPLQPGDIVYVPNSLLGSWNDVVAEIAPSVSLVSGAIEPFVQLEFLTDP